MAKTKKGLSRRRFLQGVGVAGGSAALYETMTALGLIHVPEAWAGPSQLPAGSGNGKKVIILGAGIGGLTAAYELTRAGYKCQVIELTERPGGRNHTARRGTVLVEKNKKGETLKQVCKFDEGLYLNLGPGRLPYHHRRVLHYCEELGVKLEVYIMQTMANVFQTAKAFGGKATVRRRIYNDIQGYISEMLAKAVNQKSLSENLNDEDRNNLISLLQNFGDLGKDNTYTGSTRDGCHITVYEPCEAGPKLPLNELLKSEFWTHRFYQSFEYEWQPTLFQPVGGMDKIVDGFTNKIGRLIQYRTEVLNIETRNDGGDGFDSRLEDWCSFKRHCRLLHQQHPAADPEQDWQQLRQRFRRRGGHVRLRSDVQARLAGEQSFLGKQSEPDLRRHQLHRRCDHADVVSVV